MSTLRTTQQFWTDQEDSIVETRLPNSLRDYLELEKSRIVDYCKKQSPNLVLEAGCGKGRVIEAILPYCKQIRGVDYSPSMVDSCKRKFEDSSKVSIYQEDISNIHFPNDHFDLGILAFNTIGNTDTSKEKVLLEIKRVLKPSGRLLMGAYSENAKDMQIKTYKNLGLDVYKEENKRIFTREGLVSQRFSRQDLEAWLQVCGLRGEIKPLTDIGYFVIAKGG